MFTTLEIRNTPSKVGQLLNHAHQLSDQNERIRRELAQLDQWYELAESDLQYACDYLEGDNALSYDQVKERLQAEVDYCHRQRQNLTRLLGFRKKEVELAEVERQAEFQQLGYGYQYLRSQWVHCRKLNEKAELDDRLDRLNKTVAMIRSKTHQKLADVRSDNRFLGELGAAETIQQLQKKLQGACMQREDLLARLDQYQFRDKMLSQENRRLTTELAKIKEKLKNIENKYFQSCKKNLQFEETVGDLSIQLNRLKKQEEKLSYTNHLEGWTLEIRGQLIGAGQHQTRLALQQLKQSLEEASSQENIPGRLVEARSERTFQPVRVFASNVSIAQEKEETVAPKVSSKTATNIKTSSPEVTPVEINSITPQRRPLSRQNSHDNLRANNIQPQSILKRAPTLAAASAAKLAYIRQPSREKTSEIEKSFYVRFENMRGQT